jgi:flagellar motor protein MotB
MPGGYGETDIYYCDRVGNGWSKPVNLGPNVNTFGREKFPYVDDEGNFYFASDGYMGYGGLDICVAKMENGQLTKALPLKSPINSSRDDFGIMSLQNGKTGYFSSNRVGGAGEDDIYYFDLGAHSDLVSKLYTIGYRPNYANIHINFVDSKTGKPTEKGHFWSYTKQTKKSYDADFTNGTLDYTVKERSRLFMRAYVEGYNMYYDTVVIGNLDADTNITLTFKMVKPKHLITMRGKYHRNALFDFDKSNLRPDAVEILDSVVTYMKANPEVHVKVEGHTDTRGTDAYNMKLSKRRSESCARYIKSKGISVKRMKTESFGYHQVVNRCIKGVHCSEEEHQANRRVEFRFEEMGQKTTANIP